MSQCRLLCEQQEKDQQRVAPGSAHGAAVYSKEKRPLPRALFLTAQNSVAVHLLLQLAPRLRLDGQRGRGPGEQARNADRLARLLAPTVAAVLDAAQRLINLLEELPLAVAGTQLERVLFLDRGLVRRVWLDLMLTQV